MANPWTFGLIICSILPILLCLCDRELEKKYDPEKISPLFNLIIVALWITTLIIWVSAFFFWAEYYEPSLLSIRTESLLEKILEGALILAIIEALVAAAMERLYSKKWLREVAERGV